MQGRWELKEWLQKNSSKTQAKRERNPFQTQANPKRNTIEARAKRNRSPSDILAKHKRNQSDTRLKLERSQTETQAKPKRNLSAIHAKHMLNITEPQAKPERHILAAITQHMSNGVCKWKSHSTSSLPWGPSQARCRVGVSTHAELPFKEKRKPIEMYSDCQR